MASRFFPGVLESQKMSALPRTILRPASCAGSAPGSGAFSDSSWAPGLRRAVWMECIGAGTSGVSGRTGGLPGGHSLAWAPGGSQRRAWGAGAPRKRGISRPGRAPGVSRSGRASNARLESPAVDPGGATPMTVVPTPVDSDPAPARPANQADPLPWEEDAALLDAYSHAVTGAVEKAGPSVV